MDRKKEKTNQVKTAAISRNSKQKADSENTNLDEVREFSENIIDSVREPLLVLDQDLRVVTASRSFYEFFKVSSDETIGNLIFNLGNNQWDIPKLRDLLETILPQKTTFDNYEVEHNFSTIGKRIMLLNARQIKRAFGKEKIILLAIEDVTERMELEELLTESEERFRRLFETADDGILLLDKNDGNITHANPAILEMLTCNKEECIGKKIKDIGFSLACDDIKDILQELDRNGIINYDDVLVQTKAGQVISTDIYMVDRARLVQCNIRDITERKYAENALRESKQVLEGIINSIPTRVFWKDKNLVFLGCNAIFAKDAGFTDPEEIIGKNDYQMVWRNEADLYREDDRQVIESGSAKLLIEEQQTTPEGKTITLLTNKIPLLNPQGEISGILGTYIDITERKEAEEALKNSEEKYRKFVEGDLTGDYISTPDGRLLFCNSAYIKIFGFSSMEEAMKCNLNTLYPETRSRQAFLAELTMKKELKLHESEFLNYRGETIHVLENVIGSFDQKGALVEIRGYLLDITETKKMEEQFHASQKMEAVGLLAGGVAHDFNNLLTIINGYSELLITKLNDNDPIKKDIIQIQKAGERASSLTSQLLIFSRRQIIQPKVLNINTIVTDIEKMLHRLIGEDIEFVTMLDKELGNIKADPGQMDQVIMNLAVNARDAMPEGGKLTIETSNIYLSEDYSEHHISVQPGKYILLAISDTGFGMDSETKSKIFDPFFTTKRIGKGTGLGLSTVYGIVKQSGGNIWVYSEPGKGTTFKIYLPKIEEKASVDVPFKPSFDSIKGSETILLVEDDFGVRELSYSFLTKYGYKVFVAENGEKALDFCEHYKQPIHLMITDVVMPQMGGRVLAENLLVSRPEIKVLYVSGYTNDAIVHHGVLDSDVAFLAKPFSPFELAKKVREALDNSK